MDKVFDIRKLAARVCLVSSTFFIISCATAKLTYLDNGQPAYLVKCGGWFANWNACVVKAGQVCRRRGYSVSSADEFEGRMLLTCKADSQTEKP
jgi:hypothetical protein